MRSNTSASGSKKSETLPAWVGVSGWEADVVLSTRARLARNLAGSPFPVRANAVELDRVAAQVLKAVETREKGAPALRAVEIAKLSAADKATLVDSHLISVQHAMAGQARWALVDDKHTVSVMVNEEDHLRIQAILPGLQLDAAWQIADRLDNRLAERLEYAYDPTYGFLTSSLSNCGTGLRLSVMLHLPGLALSGKFDQSLGAARTLGVAVRGLYGEASSTVGDVYQVSNAVSTGIAERSIVARLAAVTTYLLTDEQAARELLDRRNRSDIEAKVAEATAQLKASERLSAADAMAILSLLRLGDHLSMPTGVTSRVFTELLASMRIGVQYVSGHKAHSTFYEETRRPALIRNKIRQQKR